MSYYHYWCHSIHSCAATCMVWCFYFWMCVSFWVSSSQFKSNQLPHTLTHNSSRLPSIPPIHFYSFRSKAISHPHTPASLPSPFPDSPPPLRRGSCLPWLYSWLTGTALLDGRAMNRLSKSDLPKLLLCLFSFENHPLPSHTPELYCINSLSPDFTSDLKHSEFSCSFCDSMSVQFRLLCHVL